MTQLLKSRLKLSLRLLKKILKKQVSLLRKLPLISQEPESVLNMISKYLMRKKRLPKKLRKRL